MQSPLGREVTPDVVDSRIRCIPLDRQREIREPVALGALCLDEARQADERRRDGGARQRVPHRGRGRKDRQRAAVGRKVRMQEARSATQRRRVRARRRPAWLGRRAEQAVRRRRLVRPERRIGDHAARVVIGVAERDVREVAADVLPHRHLEAGAEQHDGDEPITQDRIRIDLVLDELGQHGRALRMPDEQHATAVVVVGDVLLPGVEDVTVGERGIDRNRRRSPELGDQRRQRDLTIDRREDAADRSQTCRLLADNEQLLVRTRHQIAVAARVGRDRRVDVEAVELRMARGLPPLHLRVSVGLDDGGVEVVVAHVVDVGTAEPVGRIRVDRAGVAGIRTLGGALRRFRPRGSVDTGEAAEEPDGEESGEERESSHGGKMAHPRRSTKDQKAVGRLQGISRAMRTPLPAAAPIAGRRSGRAASGSWRSRIPSPHPRPRDRESRRLRDGRRPWGAPRPTPPEAA